MRRRRSLAIASTLAATVAIYLVLRSAQAAPSTGAGAGGAASPTAPTPMIGLGRIEAGHGLVLAASEVAGVVSRVLVRAGDTIPSGAMLVQLTDTPERREAESARERLEVQRRRTVSRDVALAASEMRRQRAERALARLRALQAAGGVSAEQLDSAETALAIARNEYAQAQADRATASAERDAAARDVSVADARVAQRAVRAPFDALVLRVDVLPGAAVRASDGLVELAPRGPQVVRCELDELVAEDVVVGAAGHIRPLAGDTIWARGRVVAAAPGLSRKSLFAEVAGEPEDRRVREVRLELAAPRTLPFNARVECVIDRAPSTVAAPPAIDARGGGRRPAER